MRRVQRWPRLGLCAIAACAALGCESPAPACHFGREYSLFQSGSQGFHELATVSAEGGVAALYSDANGVHAQLLDARGAPRAAARTLMPACDGGLAAERDGKLLRVACSRRGTGDAQRDRITLYTLDQQLTEQASQSFGEAGRLSQGVALASRGDVHVLAWHDAAVSGSRIWYFDPARMAEPRPLSEDGWEASAPGLAWNGADLWASWAETRWEGERAHSRLRVVQPRVAGGSARTLIESRDAAPSPRLAVTPTGLVVSFRDRRETGRKTGLYLARVSNDGRLLGRVVRAGRADGKATPVLEPCLGGVVSATPRTFAGDYFVGVLRADTELRRLSAEQQFYEDSREFDRVAVHCERDQALLLIGERGRLLRGQAALRSTTFRCE